MSQEHMVDVKVSRQLLINTGNFNNCSSSVEITLKDVPVEKIFLVEKSLSGVLDSVQATEVSHVLDESLTASNNASKYLKILHENIDKINEQGKASIKTLMTVLNYKGQ